MEFSVFPEYERFYIQAFTRMIQERKRKGLKCEWKNGYEVFLWWMEDKNISGQYSLDFNGIDLVGLKEGGGSNG